MKKVSNKDASQSQHSDRKLHPAFVANNVREPFLSKDSRRSDEPE